MFDSLIAPNFSALVCVQFLGVLSAFAAHRSSGTGWQTCCQLASLVFMGLAGLTSLVGWETGPVRSLICGTLFACMVLMATFDRCGLGLRANSQSID
jgi:hypothetical protein